MPSRRLGRLQRQRQLQLPLRLESLAVVLGVRTATETNVYKPLNYSLGPVLRPAACVVVLPFLLPHAKQIDRAAQISAVLS